MALPMPLAHLFLQVMGVIPALVVKMARLLVHYAHARMCCLSLNAKSQLIANPKTSTVPFVMPVLGLV